MSRLNRSVSVHAPIRLSTEELGRGDLVECICREVNALTESLSHIAWVEVDERNRQDDGSAEIKITLHRCCASHAEIPEYAYRVCRVEAGRYRLDPK